MRPRPLHPADGCCTTAARLPAQADGEVRCGCGSLLARVVDGDVELKCRRCKRTWRIPIEAA
jgi:hypothetical protein